MIRLYLTTLLLFLSFFLSAQESDSTSVQNTDSTGATAIDRIFMPSFEFGYMTNASEMLTGGTFAKLSLEYRFSNINNGFLRANLDTRNADYVIGEAGATDVVEGSLDLTEFLIGGGYRGGDRRYRLFVLGQVGLAFYDYPIVERTGNTVNISFENRNVTSTRATVGIEYYFDDRNALDLEILQDQVWDRKDFWINKGGSWGISVGWVATIF
ncbi:MAG: hypothetical protein AAFP89_09225 [Bacteroidota bacterium]